MRRHFGLEGVPGAGRSRPLAELLDLTGRSVLVTGGGGPDLGSALCRRLAGQGALVGVLDATSRADSRRARRDDGRGHIPLAADVSDWAGVHAAVAAFVDRAGRLDVLVNNAGGGFGTHGPFATRSRQTWTPSSLSTSPACSTRHTRHCCPCARNAAAASSRSPPKAAVSPCATWACTTRARPASSPSCATSHERSGMTGSRRYRLPRGLLGPSSSSAWPPGPAARLGDRPGLAATPLADSACRTRCRRVAFLFDAGGYINGTELSVGGGQSA